MNSENKEKRSRIMRQVKSRDTGPEMKVRRLLHSLGYRYRLHRKDLPCKPDLVFPSKRKVIFIHGCFWHGHNCKRGARAPKTNQAYWLTKLARNKTRDLDCCKKLENLGWAPLVVWECELKDLELLKGRLINFLNEKCG